MPDSPRQEIAERQVDDLAWALDSGALIHARKLLHALHPGEVAHLFESMPSEQREMLWSLVNPEDEGDILANLNEDVLAQVTRQMNTAELLEATKGMAADDLADIVQDLPATVGAELLRGMSHQDRHRIASVLAYPEDSAGGIMNTDTVTVRADVDLDVVLRYLRVYGNIPDHTDNLIVVDRYDHYLGLLPLKILLSSDPDLTVAEVMNHDAEGIPVDASDDQVAKLFEDRDLISAPVTDPTGRLLGRITIDDVVDVIREQADHSLMSMAGLTEDHDMFGPVFNSTRRRAVWLGVNLMTAFLASWVIGIFEDTIEKVVALAILMPIVASMGGVAGSQTLTLVIRGMAVGQLAKANTRALLIKETAIGFLNGMMWAIVVAAVAVFWFDDIMIGYIIAAAMLINLVAGALGGVLLPLLLRKVNVDPALAGGVLLTTITDVVGFLSFLGLATLVYY